MTNLYSLDTYKNSEEGLKTVDFDTNKIVTPKPEGRNVTTIVCPWMSLDFSKRLPGTRKAYQYLS